MTGRIGGQQSTVCLRNQSKYVTVLEKSTETHEEKEGRGMQSGPQKEDSQ